MNLTNESRIEALLKNWVYRYTPIELKTAKKNPRWWWTTAFRGTGVPSFFTSPYFVLKCLKTQRNAKLSLVLFPWKEVKEPLSDGLYFRSTNLRRVPSATAEVALEVIIVPYLALFNERRGLFRNLKSLADSTPWNGFNYCTLDLYSSIGMGLEKPTSKCAASFWAKSRSPIARSVPPHWDPRSRLTWVAAPVSFGPAMRCWSIKRTATPWVHPAVPPPCQDLRRSHVLVHRSKNTLARWYSILEFATLISLKFHVPKKISKCSKFSSLILFQYWQLGSLHNGSCPRCCTAAGSRALSVTKKGVSVRSPWPRPPKVHQNSSNVPGVGATAVFVLSPKSNKTKDQNTSAS